MKTILFCVILLLTSHLLLAQERIVIEGRILTSDSLKPVSNAHIISKMAHAGTISGKDGHYALFAYTTDTLMITSIGFKKKFFPIDENLLGKEGGVWILLEKELVVLDEVVVKAFYEWNAFKNLITTMKPITLQEITAKESYQIKLREDIGLLFPAAKGPVQALYDIFNSKTIREKKLIKNRIMYNQELISKGRPQDTIPTQLDYK